MTAHGPDSGLLVDITIPKRHVAVHTRLRTGRITAVLGPNGAGKSTMLGAISGAVPAAGRIRIDGDEILHRPMHARGVTHLSQDPTLFTHLSVMANVAYGVRARGMSARESRVHGRELLDAVGLGGLEKRSARELSGGQGQRLALARALATDPHVLLLDEPFAALDVASRTRLRSLVRRMLTGRTALLVTHDLLDVLSLADDVLVLENGRVAQYGACEEVLAQPRTAFLAQLTGKVLARGRIDKGAGSGDAAWVVTDGGLRLPVPESASASRSDGLRSTMPHHGQGCESECPHDASEHVGDAPSSPVQERVLVLIDPAQVRLATAGRAETAPAEPGARGGNAGATFRAEGFEPHGTDLARRARPTAHSARPEPCSTVDTHVVDIDRIGSRLLLRCPELAVEVPLHIGERDLNDIGAAVRLEVPASAIRIYAEGDEHQPAP